METINILVNSKGIILVIDGTEDLDYGENFIDSEFIADGKLDKQWLYLFDEDNCYLDKNQLIKEKSTLFTINFWIESFPDIECGGYDFYCHITDIKKTKLNY
jgi:hypothetical protein